MKIKRFVLSNITSYRHRTEFAFDDRINILIGPNGGGKSNLQKALAMVLSTYFIQQYDFKSNDNEVSIEPVALWNRRALERELGRFIGNEDDQEIEIEVVPEASDVLNIRAISAHLDRLNERLSVWERRYDSYEPAAFASEIESAQSFVYRIRDFEFEEPEKGSAAWAFREYLRTFFIFMRVADGLEDVKLTSPVFFFFSERTAARRMDVQSGHFTQQNYHAGLRNVYAAAMAENTNLLQWGAQHFARLHWRAVNAAAQQREKTTSDLFQLEPDVALLTRYMSQLGYEWTFYTDVETASYTFAMRRHGQEQWQTADMFSSGEREIVHFLLATFALNVRDGVVVVDEPELHLHPRWQRIFLGLFRDLAPDRNNQFVIATHSPVFVTPETINNITRIYRKPAEGSTRVALHDVALPEKKALVRMINSQNNERVFFADKVVLVEGIKDRLVVASLLDGMAARLRNNDAIEIVEVGGKNNISAYRDFLAALGTPCYVLADRDYLSIVGDEGTRGLFGASAEKEWAALTDKKATDARSMIERLDEAIQTANLGELQKFRQYLSARLTRLRSDLTQADGERIEKEIARLTIDRVFVLKAGEIEDYLPAGVSSVEAIVELTTERNWLLRIPVKERQLEIVRIVGQMLGVEAAAQLELETQLSLGRPVFPSAIADAPRDSSDEELGASTQQVAKARPSIEA